MSHPASGSVFALLVGALSLGAAACGVSPVIETPKENVQGPGTVPGPSSPSIDAGANAPAPTPPLAPTNPSPSTPPPDATAPLVCGDTALCLDVTPIKAGTNPIPGRLMILWKQLNEGGADPMPEVGFEMPFLGTETRIEIPLAQVKAPSEANRLCVRTCGDEATCPCTSEAKVATGFVFVYEDENQDGQITLHYRADLAERVVGVGQVLVAASDKEFKPAPPKPGFWSDVFPNGIELGVRQYAIKNEVNNYYQRFSAGVTAGTSFALATCDAANPTKCSPRIPNPM